MAWLSLLSLLLLSLLSLSSGGKLDNNDVLEQAQSVNVDQSCPSDLQSLLRDLSVKLAENRLMITQLQQENGQLQTKMEAVQKDKTVLQTKMEAVEKENTVLQTKMEAVEKDNTVLQTQMEAVQKENAEQSSKLIQVDSQQQEHSSKLTEFNNEVDSQQQELKTLKSRMNQTENQVDTLRKDREDERVVFSASLFASGSGYIGPFNSVTTLTFKHVFTNIGEAYNHHTGIFTAPLRGVYSFDFYIFGGSSPTPYVWLEKNSELIISAHENPSGGSGTTGNKVFLQLEPGDVVYLRLGSGYQIYDGQDHRCSFSGRLVFLL